MAICCGKECEVYSRICGYFRPVQRWNKGKKEEFGMRKVFNVEKSMKSKLTAEHNTEKQETIESYNKQETIKGFNLK